jgi:hypothetical protein
MKFVPNASAVRTVLREHGLATFDPYQFAPAALADMVALLVEGSDPGAAANAQTTNRPESIDASTALARQACAIALVALVFSALSLGFALLR